MSLFGDIASTALGAFNTGYNIYTNKRDFDYQKALQQQIFEREDTAVQRRMADLKAAGINPNLAAGSAASAGAVVGRSSTNDVNMGSALDTLAAKKQIEMQKEQIKGQSQANNLANLNFQKGMEDWKMDRLFNLYALGFNPVVSFDSDGKLHIKANNKVMNYSDTDIAHMFDNQVLNSKNSADLLQKDVDWYTADKISGMAINAIGTASDFANWKKLFYK